MTEENQIRILRAAQTCLDVGADVDGVVMALHNCHAETLIELDDVAEEV